MARGGARPGDRGWRHDTAGGALVGAWLGFNVTEGLFSLITTIVGAAVGANLALILLDMSRALDEHLAKPPSLPVESARTRVGT